MRIEVRKDLKSVGTIEVKVQDYREEDKQRMAEALFDEILKVASDSDFNLTIDVKRWRTKAIVLKGTNRE